MSEPSLCALSERGVFPAYGFDEKFSITTPFRDYAATLLPSQRAPAPRSVPARAKVREVKIVRQRHRSCASGPGGADERPHGRRYEKSGRRGYRWRRGPCRLRSGESNCRETILGERLQDSPLLQVR